MFIRSDEKILAMEAVINTQNDRLYARDAGDLHEDGRTHLRSKKPAGVMMWTEVASDGYKSPLVFIEEGVKVSMQCSM